MNILMILTSHDELGDTGEKTGFWLEELVEGKKVTGFTNEEEEAVGLTEVVPFLLEDMLREAGGDYSKAEPFKPHVVVDGLLITGQNPPSSEPAAEALLEALAKSRKAESAA